MIEFHVNKTFGGFQSRAKIIIVKIMIFYDFYCSCSLIQRSYKTVKRYKGVLYFITLNFTHNKTTFKNNLLCLKLFY